jgi:hypothetical protein
MVELNSEREMSTQNRIASISEEYLKTWEQHDIEAMARHLHPSLHFKEPLSEITGRQSFLAFATKNLDYVKQVKIRSSFESQNEAVLIYDFIFIDPIGPQKTAAHFTFEGEQIRNIELFYDPRRLEKMMTGAPAQ